MAQIAPAEQSFLNSRFAASQPIWAESGRLGHDLSIHRHRTLPDSDPFHVGHITPDTFRRLYSPHLPTIGIPINTYSPGLQHLGAAARHLPREMGGVNVVYFPSPQSGSLYLAQSARGSVLRTTGGVLVDRDGYEFVGSFPRPVTIHLPFITAREDLPLLSLLQGVGIPAVNPISSFEDGNDKSVAYAALSARGVPVPESILFVGRIRNRDTLETQVGNFLRMLAIGPVVIKPPNAMRSENVHIVSSEDREMIASLIIRVCQIHGEALLEEFVRPWPLKRDGREWDHSMRLYSLDGETVTAVARVGPTHAPVSIATGATVMRIPAFLGWLESPLNSASIAKEFDRISKAMFDAFGRGVVASDIIIRNTGKLVVHDVNRGTVAGLEEAVGLGIDPDDRRYAPKRLLTTLLKRPELRGAIKAERNCLFGRTFRYVEVREVLGASDMAARAPLADLRVPAGGKRFVDQFVLKGAA